MSTVINIVCDECAQELEVVKEDLTNVFEFEWGQVFDRDEHYCGDCWPDYTTEHNVCKWSGKDL